MSKRLDLKGKIYGYLTVLGYAGIINSSSHWNCQCICGKIKIIKDSDLTKKNYTKSCSLICFCIQERQKEIEKIYNGCEILHIWKDEGKDTRVRVLCHCGQEFDTKWYSLKHGDTKSCGCAQYSHCADLSILLKEKHESYYWLGFLFADGTFAKNNQVAVSASVKDKDQIEKFAKFINYTGTYRYYIRKEEDAVFGNGEMVSISSGDSVIVPQLKEKFNISNRKTYEPCNLQNIPKDLLISLIIGFIDGDGWIGLKTSRPYCEIHIKIHSCWLENLQFMANSIAELLNLKPNIARINKEGYAVVKFSSYKIAQGLKRYAIENKFNSSILSRKWDKVDLNYMSQYDINILKKNKIDEYLVEGKSIQEIFTLLQFSAKGIRTYRGIEKYIKKKNKLNFNCK